MKPKELNLQDSIINRLMELDLYPYSVIFTSAINNTDILSITFFTKEQLDSFLILLDYDTLCDKSGIIILADSFTVLLSGIALIKFYMGKTHENN